MPSMKILFALIAAVVLLFGCTASVPQEKYDALSSSCAKAKNDSAALLSSANAKQDMTDAQLSSCLDGKQSLQSLVAERDSENAALSAQKAVLDAARVKTDLAAQYNLTMEYYLESFGPGRLPNTARLKKIDTQVSSLHDSAILPLWVAVKNCQSITGCDSAKAAFVQYIDDRMASLDMDAAAIVGKGQ